MPTSTRTAHPQNHTNCVELSNPPNLRRGGVLPLPRGTMLRIWAHQCGMVCTRRGGRPCPPGRMHDRFLRNPSANSQLPNGRTESSAPTGRCALSPSIVQFCDCVPPGRCGHRPLQTYCVVAVRCADLRVHPAREGQASPLRYDEMGFIKPFRSGTPPVLQSPLPFP